MMEGLGIIGRWVRREDTGMEGTGGLTRSGLMSLVPVPFGVPAPSVVVGVMGPL